MIARRRFLRISALGAASALLPSAGIPSAGTEDERPNVLIIIADDMNDDGSYDALDGLSLRPLLKDPEAASGAVGSEGMGEVARGTAGLAW
ncbi:MAG: hypothetical protein ACYTAS_00720 [Planctomycetota bacterium]|jgi:hypothetical protein